MDIQQLIDAIKALIELMFGGQPPQWLLPGIAWLLALGLILYGLTFLLAQIKKLWTEYLQPVFYNPDEKLRRQRRQRFAEHIESEIKRLNLLESWHDYRFAELEAEVEAEGQTLLFGQFQLPWLNQNRLRREESLSNALGRSRERLILLEGEPGAGKSVALRHITQLLARKASMSRNLNNLIPIYVNLKELRRPAGVQVDRDFIKTFLLKTLNRVNDRDVYEFLDAEFDPGLRAGTWLFLFDSFDEIPEVLSSSEADETIRLYAEAIRDFLHGMNTCRGVIASREYRGPHLLGWPRFRILPLSDSRCISLIKHAGLPSDKLSLMIGELAQATTDFRAVASNPMFLGLLCDYMRERVRSTFPHHTHEVFREYFQKRLQRDAGRVKNRFGLTPDEVLPVAEKLAFCMTLESGLGLSPTRDQLKQVTLRLGFNLGSDFDRLLDSLEFLKLARSEGQFSEDETKRFGFAHRRFQEYFATSIILREPQRVPARELLTGSQWRETVVVLLQTQSPGIVRPLLDEALGVLTTMIDGVNQLSRQEVMSSTADLESGGTLCARIGLDTLAYNLV